MTSETTQTKPFSGRTKERTTRRSVKAADALARATITIGGIGAIITVLAVCFFLVWVVFPLFRSARVQGPNDIPMNRQTARPLHVAVDEYQLMAWVLSRDAKIRLFRLDNGQKLSETRLFEGGKVACASFKNGRPEVAFGFADGRIQVVKIDFETTYPPAEEIPQSVREELAAKPKGASAQLGEGLVQVTPEGQFRRQKLRIEKLRARTVSQTSIQLIDFVTTPSGQMICIVTGDANALELKAIRGEERDDFLTGGKTLAFGSPIDLPMKALSSSAPSYLGISGVGSDVYVAWEDGWLLRIHCSDLKKAFIAEEGRLVKPGNSLTAIGFILGGTTLVWGDSKGEVRGGFPVRYKEFRGEGLYDSTLYRQRAQYTFAVTKRLASADSAMISMSPSCRSRLVACGLRDGHVRIFNVTNEGCLASLQIPSDELRREGGAPVIGLAISPREDGLLAVTPGHGWFYRLQPGHPDANMAAFFRPVWYEGYAAPLHVWQSSSGADDFEPKFGMTPLVFGTVKATFYAMLFGAPLALLAAVYSSEFLTPRARGVVKPMIELMASLPSVVLGFLAAMVFAPFVENVIPTMLSLCAAIPFSFLLGAYVWQLLPRSSSLRFANRRFIFMVLPMLFGVFLAAVVGPWIEKMLFDGDIKAWLAWRPGIGESYQGVYSSPFGGWALLCLPISVLTTALSVNRLITPRICRPTASLGRTAAAWVELIKFSAAVLIAIVLTALAASGLSSMGLDPRGDFVLWATDISPLDVYVQRNALIVGFVMGFAIIPIIYTIAEDALSAVPEHLRSASLGAGATQWQTAIRIVIPTAMSGIFSALMIGLGRAVGETMIVLMALGNTPIMDWNIFNGARTLSANIAVELPEAVRNSTHYRTLFLAALVLFAMTFVVNTAAEAVRLRFRKRAYRL